MITTARDMFIAFLHGIQKEDEEGIPAEKFNFWINKAQEDWLTERSKDFDTVQKRIDDLYLLRTERIVNINGDRYLTVPAAMRVFDDGKSADTGYGSFIVDSERYFSLSGLEFYSATANTGTIDFVTGEAVNVTTGDIFYAMVWYSEMTYPLITKLTITASGDPSIIYHTYTSVLSVDRAAYTAALADAVRDNPQAASSDTMTEIHGADIWGTANALIIGVDAITFHNDEDYRFLIPNGYPNPKYFRLMNVLFMVTYVGNVTFEDGISNWLKALLMRADERADIMQNAFRFPTDEKPYYRLLGEFIEFITETDSTPLKMKLEYLRYPLEIKYVEPLSDDVAVDCEFQHVQQKEIVDMAVRMFIEATQSPRYQTQIAEEQIKNENE